eukprot:6129041-Pyramimonas_sp.AAC.1
MKASLDEAPGAFPQVFGACGTARWSSGPFRGPPEVMEGFRVPSNPPALCFLTSPRSYPPSPTFQRSVLAISTLSLDHHCHF